MTETRRHSPSSLFPCWQALLPAGALITVALALPFGDALGQATPGCGTVVPCSDRRGCPDLVADTRFMNPFISQETWTSDQCAVVEGQVDAGDRRLLRFTTVTPNLGPGDVIIGKPSNFPELFETPTCHGHPHVKGYAAYRLWTVRGYQDWLALRQNNPTVCSIQLLADNPRISREMVAGRKQGFCLVDVQPSDFGPCLGAKKTMASHRSCFNDMGISVCWADGYGYFLDGQWIDVTGLRGGDYMLEHEANPSRVVQETDYLNNTAAIPVTIP